MQYYYQSMFEELRDFLYPLANKGLNICYVVDEIICIYTNREEYVEPPKQCFNKYIFLSIRFNDKNQKLFCKNICWRIIVEKCLLFVFVFYSSDTGLTGKIVFKNGQISNFRLKIITIFCQLLCIFSFLELKIMKYMYLIFFVIYNNHILYQYTIKDQGKANH